MTANDIISYLERVDNWSTYASKRADEAQKKIDRLRGLAAKRPGTRVADLTTRTADSLQDRLNAVLVETTMKKGGKR